MSAPLRNLLLLLIPLLAGCASTSGPPRVSGEAAQPCAVHIYVTRPLKLIPEPTAFVDGCVMALRERLVLAGYDSTGVTYDPEDELLVDLAQRNERLPGTAAIHMTFVEAPLGFAFIFARVGCAVYGPRGQVLLEGRLDPPPRRSLSELILPPKRPEVDGRRWGGKVWSEILSLALPRRARARLK